VTANGAAVTVATVVPSRTKSTCAVPAATVAVSATGPDTTAPLPSPENAGGVGGAGGVGSGTVGSGVTVPASDPGAVAEVWGPAPLPLQERAPATARAANPWSTRAWRAEQGCTSASRWSDE